jgi:hypothetical protein
MVVLTHFVVSLSVAQVDAADRPFALHGRDRAKNARVVRRAQRSAHDLMQLIDRPCVPFLTLENDAYGVGYRAGSGHIEIINLNAQKLRKSFVQYCRWWYEPSRSWLLRSR